jgi:hypothetical protein
LKHHETALFSARRSRKEPIMGKKTHDTELTVAELRKRFVEGKTLLADLRALFPEAHAVAKDDRLRSQGKMSTMESRALRGVVDAIDAEPAIFASLADEDEGHDPDRVETDLLRDRFDRHDLYAEVATELEALAGVFSDTALAIGAQVKPVTLAAYEIAKPISKRHPKIREKIAPTLDYYASNAAAAAAARRAAKEAPK